MAHGASGSGCKSVIAKGDSADTESPNTSLYVCDQLIGGLRQFVGNLYLDVVFYRDPDWGNLLGLTQHGFQIV